LHKARRLEKNQALNVNDRDFENIVQLARQRGMMTVATIDDRVCGGLICWHVNGHYIMKIIAHDSAFNEFKMGNICCYHTMQACIERSGKSFHFMSGRLEYKYRFLGVEQYFDRIIIYRSKGTMLRNGKQVIKNAIDGALRDLKLWTMNAEKKSDPLSVFATACLHRWRKIKYQKSALLSAAMRENFRDPPNA
jgi:hypothetical protein